MSMIFMVIPDGYTLSAAAGAFYSWPPAARTLFAWALVAVAVAAALEAPESWGPFRLMAHAVPYAFLWLATGFLILAITVPSFPLLDALLGTLWMILLFLVLRPLFIRLAAICWQGRPLRPREMLRKTL